nr:uncharacterized mitochondrial protein AtMg00820-like [Tanacetum cinerariifolium]
KQPTEGELDLLFEAMYNDYFGGQPSATVETVPPAQEPQVCQTSTASTTSADNVAIPTNSSSHATNIPITLQDVDLTRNQLRSDGDMRIFALTTKKIMEIMNVSFDELSAMAFKQRSSKPGLQSMTSGQISSGLYLNYAPSTITKKQPTEGELDLLFEAMYNDYFGGQPSATVETISPAQEPQVCQTSTASTTSADNVAIPTNSSSHATNIPITLQDVDELNPNAMVDGYDRPCMDESMQEELLQFKRMDVWVLVPFPDNISLITLKWIFKKKHDEEQTVIRNKSRLVVR